MEQHGSSEAARVIFESEKTEIRLYRRYRDDVGYGYHIARKVDGGP